ncbi:unknown kinase with AarF domain [Dorcoceras hygrometricum]|uniref:Uncharacterized protein n=1 Tax=Dorcoceras hygrometricum TaxID=472368 RepID=A0A2Z7AMV5_9LAMI|nr:unknown kinase with AarF domain [Dorcoceras hygrometricum]
MRWNPDIGKTTKSTLTALSCNIIVNPCTNPVFVNSSPNGTVMARATPKLSGIIPILCVNALKINEWVTPEYIKKSYRVGIGAWRSSGKLEIWRNRNHTWALVNVGQSCSDPVIRSGSHTPLWGRMKVVELVAPSGGFCSLRP